jgi:hypothetical protein
LRKLKPVRLRRAALILRKTVQLLANLRSYQDWQDEQQRRDFEAALAQQQKQIDALTAGLQKVSAQLELSKPANGGEQSVKLLTYL